MEYFKFIDYGENLGTRQLGVIVRERLVCLMNSTDKVVLDFSGVKVVSNSFADESIGKLLLTMSLDELKNKTTFRNVNTFAKANIAIALKRRLGAISRQSDGWVPNV